MMPSHPHTFAVKHFSYELTVDLSKPAAKSIRCTTAGRKTRLRQHQLREQTFLGKYPKIFPGLIIVDERNDYIPDGIAAAEIQRRYDTIHEDQSDAKSPKPDLELHTFNRVIRSCQSVTTRNEDMRHVSVKLDALEQSVETGSRKQISFYIEIEKNVAALRRAVAHHLFDDFRCACKGKTFFFGPRYCRADIFAGSRFVFATRIARVKQQNSLPRSLRSFHDLFLTFCSARRRDDSKEVLRRRRSKYLHHTRQI
ncbi:MAG: hypothetical protein K8U03_25490 [Planctomycetia bacterium]|nr:hypothetical protein [Planctomycetia bacterium]